MFGWIKRALAKVGAPEPLVEDSAERTMAMARAMQARRDQRARAEAVAAQSRQATQARTEDAAERERRVAEARRLEGERYAQALARQRSSAQQAPIDNVTPMHTWTSGFYTSGSSGCSDAGSSSSDSGSCGGGD